MTTMLVIGLSALAIAAGARLLPLDRLPASTSIAIWLCTLFVGAATTVAAAVFAVVYVPSTDLYANIAGLCLHTALPIVSSHLMLSGHAALHLALIFPFVALLLSTLWLFSRITSGWWVLRSRLREAQTMKEGCLVIQDDAIVVGVTPVGRGRIVVSDTTLRTMDQQELHASLSHEMGHLRRGHRPIVFISKTLAAVSFPFPGSRQARNCLLMALERDADEYAVQRTRNPLALASAICKAASGSQLTGELGLGGGAVSRRLDYLDGGVEQLAPRPRRAIQMLCLVLIAGTAIFSTALTMWALTLPRGGHTWFLLGTIC